MLNTGQRQALADLARQHDLLIIEDAAYARLVRPSAAAGGQLCAGKNGVCHRIFKNIATGLRVGVVISPPPLSAGD